MSEQCQLESHAANHSADNGCCDLSERLLAMADEAWHELLKEKIKVEIAKSCATSLDALAKLVAENNRGKWAHTIKGKVKCDEYKQKIHEILLGAAMS